MVWIIVTEIADKQERPSTKLNMDRIVRITPMQNMGCLLTTDAGRDIMVKELLNHFDVLDNVVDGAPRPVVAHTTPAPQIIKQETKVELDDDALMTRISEVIKRSLRGPNSEVNKRLRTVVREVLDEQNKPIEEDPITLEQFTPPAFKRRIPNTTSNIMG